MCLENTDPLASRGTDELSASLPTKILSRFFGLEPYIAFKASDFPISLAKLNPIEVGQLRLSFGVVLACQVTFLKVGQVN